MAQNPLQQYFRQPKIFVSLPSKGVYSKQGSITGDVTNMPVYGMTGMDEILMKTPDALMSGESTIRIIESCCPFIKDGSDLSLLDLDLTLTAIRIATYGNIMEILHTCPACNTENEYHIDLGKMIEHFATCHYDNEVILKDLTIKTQPLTYQQSTEFNIKNFQLQQQLRQTEAIEDEAEQKRLVAEIFKELGLLQNEIFSASIESVQTTSAVVSERLFINEWLSNCDKTVFDSLRDQFEKNRETWKVPGHEVKCDTCGSENKVAIDLDEASFFARA